MRSIPVMRVWALALVALVGACGGDAEPEAGGSGSSVTGRIVVLVSGQGGGNLSVGDSLVRVPDAGGRFEFEIPSDVDVGVAFRPTGGSEDRRTVRVDPGRSEDVVFMVRRAAAPPTEPDPAAAPPPTETASETVSPAPIEPRPTPVSRPARETTPPVRRDPPREPPAEPPPRDPPPRDPPAQPPPTEAVELTTPDEGELTTVEFTTTPAGASVRLTNVETGEAHELTTPGQISVAGGRYRWEVSAEGFLTARSAGDLVVRGGAPTERVSLALEAASSQSLLDDGMAAFFQNEFPRARELLEQAEEPAQRSGDYYQDYIRSRIMLGFVYLDQNEFQRAIDGLGRALELDPRAYEARFLLGRALRGVQQCSAAARAYSEIRGPMAANIPRDRIQVVRAMALYESALCWVDEHDRLVSARENPTGQAALRARIVSLLERFLDEASSLRGYLFNDGDLADARLDARQTVERLRS